MTDQEKKKEAVSLDLLYKCKAALERIKEPGASDEVFAAPDSEQIQDVSRVHDDSGPSSHRATKMARN